MTGKPSDSSNPTVEEKSKTTLFVTFLFTMQSILKIFTWLFKTILKKIIIITFVNNVQYTLLSVPWDLL